jgi:two-component system CheB/CheR fusion protein
MTEPEFVLAPLFASLAAERRAARLGALLDKTAVAVLLKDLSGRYQFVNRAAARLLGRTPPEVLGQSDADLLPVESAAAARDAERRVLASGETLVHEETQTVDGLARRLLFTRGVFRNVFGQLTGLFCVVRDTADGAEIEEEMVLLAAQVETPQEAALMLRPFSLHTVAALMRERREQRDQQDSII